MKKLAYMIIILICALVSYAFIATVVPSRSVWEIGQCVVLRPQPDVPFDASNIVRIEGIENGKYIYRWWTFQREWALDQTSQVGEYATFHGLFYPCKCPRQKIGKKDPWVRP